MFHAHSTLIQAAMVLGIDPHLVNVVNETPKEQVSRLFFGSVKIKVSQEEQTGKLISATFTPDDMNLSFQTRFMEPDYSALANIIEAVVTEKLYSSPWVTHAIVAKVDKDVAIESIFIHERDITTVNLACKGESGCVDVTGVDVVATVGNKPFSYCYAVYAGEKMLLHIDKEASLDKLTSTLAKGIEDYYNTWKASVDAPAPATDDQEASNPLEQVFKAVKEHCDKHPDGNTAIAFSASETFAVNIKGTNDGYFITYTPSINEIAVYQYTGKGPNAYYYRLFMKTDTINEEIKNRIVSFVCSKNRGLF